MGCAPAKANGVDIRNVQLAITRSNLRQVSCIEDRGFIRPRGEHLSTRTPPANPIPSCIDRRRLLKSAAYGIGGAYSFGAWGRSVAEAPRTPSTSRRLSRSQQLEDFEILVRSLEYAHVGLTRYEALDVFQNRAAMLRESLQRTSSEFEFLRKIATFNAQLRSGHLFTIPSGGLAQRLADLPRLPLQLRFIGRLAFVWQDLTSAGIPRGSELLSINGRRMTEVVAAIWPSISSDGYIETRKSHLLNVTGFPEWDGFDIYFAIHVERPAHFRVCFRAPGASMATTTLSGLSRNDKSARLAALAATDVLSTPGYEVLPLEGSAVLKLPRLFKLPSETWDFRAILTALIDELHLNKLGNLIVDIRGNTGGLDEFGAVLYGHLSDEPFRFYRQLYYRQIEFSALRATIEPTERDRVDEKYPDRYTKDAEHGFWRKEGTYPGLSTTAPYQYTRTPFLGNVYLLIDGGTYSAGSQCAAFFLDRRRALIIGEEGGGDYGGPDGGASLPIVLPHSGITVRIPYVRSLQNSQPWIKGRGPVPHIYSRSTIDDMLTGRDAPMDLARKLIRSSINLDAFVAGASRLRQDTL